MELKADANNPIYLRNRAIPHLERMEQIVRRINVDIDYDIFPEKMEIRKAHSRMIRSADAYLKFWQDLFDRYEGLADELDRLRQSIPADTETAGSSPGSPDDGNGIHVRLKP